MDVSDWIARTYVGSWLLFLEDTVALDGYEDLRLVERRSVASGVSSRTRRENVPLFGCLSFDEFIFKEEKE